MEDYVWLGLLLAALVILLFIFFEEWFKQRRLKAAKVSMNKVQPYYGEHQHASDSSCTISLAPTEGSAKKEDSQDVLVISVFAKPGSHFASYELLQTITSTGLQFGEMNIFHYYMSTDTGTETLFSLASATKPGSFNLDKIGEFTCVGLTLFMDLKTVSEPELALTIMLKTAEQLAEDLDGELRAGPHLPWNQDVLQQYQQRIFQFQTVAV